MKHIVKHTRKILDWSKPKSSSIIFLCDPVAIIINSMLKEKNCTIFSRMVFATPVQPSQNPLTAFTVPA
jgi:hypothetical protein